MFLGYTVVDGCGLNERCFCLFGCERGATLETLLVLFWGTYCYCLQHLDVDFSHFGKPHHFRWSMQ